MSSKILLLRNDSKFLSNPNLKIDKNPVPNLLLSLLSHSDIPFVVTSVWDHLHFTNVFPFHGNMKINENPTLYLHDIIVEHVNKKLYEVKWTR